jgi:putative AlgH/UPF0301 family transcriptional regulator
MTNPLVIRTLYRSLLRAAKPFSSPSPNAVVLSCLLHRTGIDDAVAWDPSPIATETTEKTKGPRQPRSVDEARDLSRSYAEEDNDDMSFNPFDERHTPNHILFRRLLREVVTGTDGYRQMQFPSDMDTNRLKQVIRREFRSTSSKFDAATRQQVAFFALRELNKKLSWAECLSKGIKEKDPESILDRNQRQTARNVSRLPLDPASYLRAGTYLVAHPLLTGFFRRAVICILDHTETESAPASRIGGTYGLIVNRISTSPSSGRRRTLKEVLRTLPPELVQAFGNCSVREGGPVHLSLQMIHARTPDQPALGGTVLRASAEKETTSTALDSDRAVYYQGNMLDAADAVINGALDRGKCRLTPYKLFISQSHLTCPFCDSDDVSFYVGASCWDVGQLEGEIERGYFIPCRGPPSISLTGSCERVGDDDKDMNRPKADLWLSMMCAMGEDEANLAHLLSNDDDFSDFGESCDMP